MTAEILEQSRRLAAATGQLALFLGSGHPQSEFASRIAADARQHWLELSKVSPLPPVDSVYGT